MANAVSGVISKINFRQINQDGTPNQWQKTHRASLLIDGTYYRCAEVKPSPKGDLQLRIQSGKDWVTLNEGDEVQFFTKSRTVGDKTYYDKDGQIKLVKAGNGPGQPASPAGTSAPATSPPRAAASASSSSPTGGAKPDAMQDRIVNGMLLNNAVAYAAAKDVEPAELENFVVTAAAVFRRALIRIGGGDVGNDPQQAQPATSTVTSASEPAPDAVHVPANTASAQASQSRPNAPTFEDDDIPFN